MNRLEDTKTKFVENNRRECAKWIQMAYGGML